MKSLLTEQHSGQRPLVACKLRVHSCPLTGHALGCRLVTCLGTPLNSGLSVSGSIAALYTPGTYVWSWGDRQQGTYDEFVLNIGAVPEPGSTLAMLVLVTAGLMGVRRRRA
jgi:hypothetical protein